MRDYKKLLFLYNPKSGKGTIKTFLSDIIDIMIKSGFEVDIYPTQSRGDATRRIRESNGEFDRVVCSGGDGTLNEVVEGLMSSETKVPFGYIPAGSTNDFGNSMGIDKDMLNAAKIAAGKNTSPIDIGCFNSDYFVYVAAFGIFTEVSYQTSQEMKNLLGHAAYLLESVKQLSDIPTFKLTIESEGKVIKDEFIYGMITNSTTVGGIKDFIKGDVNMSDGKFEVMMIRNPKNPVELSEILLFLTNIKKETEMVYSFSATSIKIVSEEDVPWTLDGEFGGSYKEVDIKNVNEALEIMVE